jgi:hypothetical protein
MPNNPIKNRFRVQSAFPEVFSDGQPACIPPECRGWRLFIAISSDGHTALPEEKAI